MTKADRPNKKPYGIVLKEARESKGVSLRTVHEATKIPLDVLKAIEEGYTVRTLTSFYEKAFTKKYAEYLGLDANAVLSDFPREQRVEPKKPIKPIRSIKFSPERMDTFFTRERQRQIVKIVGVVIVLFMLGRVVGCIKNRRRGQKKKVVKTQQVNKEEKKKDKKTEKKAKAEKKKVAVAPKPSKVKPKPKPKLSSPGAPRPAITKKVSLTVKAKKKVWLQVKVDGNTVFQSTLKAGVTETWQADKTIELSGRNIHYLEFEVNGEVLGTLGRADREARRVVITKEGLSVRK